MCFNFERHISKVRHRERERDISQILFLQNKWKALEQHIKRNNNKIDNCKELRCVQRIFFNAFETIESFCRSVTSVIQLYYIISIHIRVENYIDQKMKSDFQTNRWIWLHTLFIDTSLVQRIFQKTTVYTDEISYVNRVSFERNSISFFCSLRWGNFLFYCCFDSIVVWLKLNRWKIVQLKSFDWVFNHFCTYFLVPKNIHHSVECTKWTRQTA